MAKIMTPRKIEKQNKGWVYRFDLSFCKLAFHSLVGRVVGVFNHQAS